MTVTQFRHFLARHGADLSRWEGADLDAARALIESSEEARGLYREAQALDGALDSFDPGPVDPALLERVMARIDGPQGGAVPQGATVHQLPLAKRHGFGGGGLSVRAAALAACAAAVVLSFSLLSPRHGGVPQAADVDGLLSEFEQMAEEDVAAQEIIGLWEVAASGQAGDEDIENFLDHLFSDPVGDSGFGDESDPVGNGVMDL